MVTIRINNVYSQIDGLKDVDIIDKIDTAISYYMPGYQYMKAYRSGYWDKKTGKRVYWDGKTHLLNKSMRFQTGLVPHVEEVLTFNEVPYNLVDERLPIQLGNPIPTLKSYYTPRDYQLDIVEAAIKHKSGIIKAATGAGKSFCIAMLTGRLNVRTVIYVISLDLLYDMQKTIQDALGIKCGIVGDGHCEIKKVTIATPWTVAQAFDKKYDPFDDEEAKVKEDTLSFLEKKQIVKMVEASEMFIFDEAQFLGAESLQLIAQASKNARYRFGLSGTPWRDNGDDILLEAAVGKKIVDISATSLIERGVLVTPRIFFFTVPEYPTELEKNYQTIYEKYIVTNDVRNQMIIDAAKNLIKKKRKILILVKRKKHGIKLLEMMPSNIRTYYLNGDAPAEERMAVKDIFNADGLDVIIASSIFDQGIDLPTLDALILAGSGKSSSRALQRIGRVIRGSTGKTDAIVVDFIDTEKYVYEHSKKRHAIYKTEAAFKIKLPDDLEKI